MFDLTKALTTKGKAGSENTNRGCGLYIVLSIAGVFESCTGSVPI